jgi:hypothetical protein
MRDLFEYGVTERIWDVFKTMHMKEVIPEEAYLIFELIGLKPTLQREELMELFIQIANSCHSVEEFEDYLFEQKIPSGFNGICPEVFFVFQPVSHVKMSFWRNREII